MNKGIPGVDIYLAKVTGMVRIVLVCFFLLGLAQAQQDLLLRVLLAEATNGTVQLGPHQRQGAYGMRDSGSGAFRITVGSGEVLVDGQSAGPWVEFVPADGFTFGGRSYRGNLLVVWQAGRALFINRVWLEDYLLGVVPGEVPASFPDPVLQAQAILARTFALYRLNPKGLYDLCATERCQVYLGRSAETPRHTQAVYATRSLIVSYNQKPITAVYHADSGGYTAASVEVWGNNVPYLVARPDPLAVSPSSSWSRTLRLRIVGSSGSVELDAPQSTRLLRGLGLPSTRVRFDGWQVFGQGSGHGVGMSQWGARGLALQGWDFRQILGYYYPGTFLSSFEVVAGLREQLRLAGYPLRPLDGADAFSGGFKLHRIKWYEARSLLGARASAGEGQRGD
jgi:stage II sporulation protein D